MASFLLPNSLSPDQQDLLQANRDVSNVREKIMAQLVRLDGKADKAEHHRIIVVSRFRIIVTTAYKTARTELLQSISSLSSVLSSVAGHLALEFTDFSANPPKRCSYCYLATKNEGVDDLLRCLSWVTNSVFMKPAFGIAPAPRSALVSSFTPPLAADGASVRYAVAADNMGLSPADSVCWDINSVLVAHDDRTLKLAELCQGLDKTGTHHCTALLQSLREDTWFRCVDFTGFKFASADQINEFINAISRNSTLEELKFHPGLNVKSDFLQKLADAVARNESSRINSVDVTGMPQDKDGLVILLRSLKRPVRSLTATQLNAKCAVSVLREVGERSTALEHLSLVATPLNDCSTVRVAAVALLTHLDLRATEVNADMLFTGLTTGPGCSSLKYLNLSSNAITFSGKRQVSAPILDFFKTCSVLETLHLAECRFSEDFLVQILRSIARNTELKTALSLDLSRCELSRLSWFVMAIVDLDPTPIRKLILRDNGLSEELVTLLSTSTLTSLTHLDISQNQIKPKHLESVKAKLVSYIVGSSVLEDLNLSDLKLRYAAAEVVGALVGVGLKRLDISNNAFGDVTASHLSKSLQVDCRLEEIWFDNNAVSLVGFSEIVAALDKNISLKMIHIPYFDLLTIKDRSRASAVVEALERAVVRRGGSCSESHEQRHRYATTALYSQLYDLERGCLKREHDTSLAGIIGDCRKLSEGIAVLRAEQLDLDKLKTVFTVALGEVEKAARVTGKTALMSLRQEILQISPSATHEAISNYSNASHDVNFAADMKDLMSQFEQAVTRRLLAYQSEASFGMFSSAINGAHSHLRVTAAREPSAPPQSPGPEQRTSYVGTIRRRPVENAPVSLESLTDQPALLTNLVAGRPSRPSAKARAPMEMQVAAGDEEEAESQSPAPSPSVDEGATHNYAKKHGIGVGTMALHEIQRSSLFNRRSTTSDDSPS